MLTCLLIIKALSLGCILLIAVLCDLRSSKIPNKLILAGMIAGVALNLAGGAYLSAVARSGPDAGGPIARSAISDGPVVSWTIPKGPDAGGTDAGGPAGMLPSQGGLTGAVLGVLLSIMIPFVSLIALYALKMLGAGDIKLLMSMGAIVGAWPIVEIMAYSILAGGALSLFIVLANKQGRACARRFLTYVRACYLQRRLLPYGDAEPYSDAGPHGKAEPHSGNTHISSFSKAVSNGGMVKFSLGIAAGTVAYVIKKIFWYSLSCT